MKPLIILWNDGREVWYPSLSDAVRDTDINRETLRSIIENGRFGRRNYQGIESAWWSDFNHTKFTRLTVETLISRKFRDEWFCENVAFYLFEQYYASNNDNYFENEYENREKLLSFWKAMPSTTYQQEALVNELKRAYNASFNTAECVEDLEDAIVNISNNLHIIRNFGSMEGDE